MSAIKEGYDTILWDLDGTLLNVKRRLYLLFCELTGEELGFDKYWELKKRGYNQQRMLEFIHYQKENDNFQSLWLTNVERNDLLETDTLVFGAKEVLSRLKENDIKMYIVTNRQNYANLTRQLDILAIRNYFEGIVSTFQRCSKAEVVLNRQIDISKAIFIGDSVEDMQAAKELKVYSIMIAGENVENYGSEQADTCVKEIKDIEEIIL